MVFGVVVSAAPDIAYAAGSELSYDKTNVMDDLTSSTVNGQPFDVKDYPYDEDSQAQIVNFVEYCYSYKGNMQSNYGLYVYVYNPQGLNISTNSKSNKIQMAVSYDSEGNPNDYAKFDLLFLSKSEDSNYKNLFYKFKVADREINGTTFKDRVNSNERRYDVSGIELMEYGKVNAVEYSCGGSYIFTGYAEGYGPDPAAKSTLTSAVRESKPYRLMSEGRTTARSRVRQAKTIRTSSKACISAWITTFSNGTGNCRKSRRNGMSIRRRLLLRYRIKAYTIRSTAMSARTSASIRTV